MRSFFITLLLTLFVLSFRVELMAQEPSCSSRLQNAKEKYNSGLVQDVPDLLNDCIQNGFTEKEKMEAFKLLINAYIFDDDIRQAQSTMLTFLKTFPRYSPSPDDTPEFLNLLDQFDNRPRLSLGLLAGSNLSFIRVTEPFGVENLNRVSGKYDMNGPSYHFGFTMHFFLKPALELGFEPVYLTSQYNYTVSPFSFTTVDYSESQTRLELPVTLTYCFKGRRLSPYVLAGVAPSVILSARGSISRSFQNNGDSNFTTISENDIDMTDQRNLAGIMALAGTGLRFNMRYSYLYLDLRYCAGLGNQVKSSSRNDPASEMTWRYYYIPDNFSMDNLWVSLGFTRILYHPRRK